VGAGLEGDVDRGARRILPTGAAVLNRDTLGVQLAELCVEALADHLAVAGDHGADQRIGADLPPALLRELEGTPQIGRFLFGADRGDARLLFSVELD